MRLLDWYDMEEVKKRYDRVRDKWGVREVRGYVATKPWYRPVSYNQFSGKVKVWPIAPAKAARHLTTWLARLEKEVQAAEARWRAAVEAFRLAVQDVDASDLPWVNAEASWCSSADGMARAVVTALVTAGVALDELRYLAHVWEVVAPAIEGWPHVNATLRACLAAARVDPEVSKTLREVPALHPHYPPRLV